jgi:hypothetical protein
VKIRKNVSGKCKIGHKTMNGHVIFQNSEFYFNCPFFLIIFLWTGQVARMGGGERCAQGFGGEA